MYKKAYSIKCVLAGLIALGASSCSKSDDNRSSSSKAAPYLLGVGITTSSGTTSSTANYIVQANSLDSGVISPLGVGLTLVGYRDYAFGNATVFAVGGLGETNINGVTQSEDGKLVLAGSATLDASADDIIQLNDNQMLALKLPAQADGDKAIFSFINIATKAVDSTKTSPTAPLIFGGDNPIYTGIAVRDSLVFLSYMHFSTGYATNHVDSNYIAVYTYPGFKFRYNIYDTRTGPTGAWQTKNGLFKDENGDIYAMSSSNISNGFDKSNKPGGFLRIKKGTTQFDASYFWNTDVLGGKISHIKYLGNGKLFATISTIEKQTSADRWGDKSLKMAIIDLYGQKIQNVVLKGGVYTDLIHDGNGGRSFPVMYDNGKVYYTATIGGVSNIYVVDVATATATKGARVDATFVGGIFKVK